MRTLDAALVIELGLTITRPGYLVEINFSTPQYLSTMGAVSWGGRSWVASDVRVDSLRRESGSDKSAQISLGNLDNGFGAVVLSETISDKSVKIYAAYAGAASAAVLEFDGVGDAAEVGERVTLALLGVSTQNAFTPRRTICAATGFNSLLPVGTMLTIGNTIYKLERS